MNLKYIVFREQRSLFKHAGLKIRRESNQIINTECYLLIDNFMIVTRSSVLYNIPHTSSWIFTNQHSNI
jgi:hypothetical protein